MRKIIHWVMSITAALVIAVVAIALLAVLGYCIYQLVTEGTFIAVTGVVMGIAYLVGPYIEEHGWAWNPKD